MCIVETTYKRFRMVKNSPDNEFFTALTNESITFWNIISFRDQLKNEDSMISLEPQRDIAQKTRMLCCSINIIGQKEGLKKQKEVKGKQIVSKKSKKIKKKLTKDEKKILLNQKT